MGKRPKAAQEAPDIEPLDVDGVRTVSLLTVLWGVAFVILVVRRTVLEAEGNGWWLWTCLAGAGLGLLGVEYTRRRRDAIEYAKLQAEAAEEDNPELDVVTPHPAQSYDTGAVPPSADNVTRPIASHTTGPPSAVTGQQPPHVTGQQAPITGQQPVVPDRPLPRRDPRQARDTQLPRTAPPPATSEGAAATTGSFPRVDDESREFSAYRPKRARTTPEPPTSNPQSVDDDPLLETTLGGSRRSRRASDEKNEPEESAGSNPSSFKYRGRRRRRDAS